MVCLAVGMLISLIWNHKVFLNIAHMTSCHVVASWYFEPEQASEGCPCCRVVTWTGLKRSCINYLGSIAFGSLIVAILEAIYYTCKYECHPPLRPSHTYTCSSPCSSLHRRAPPAYAAPACAARILCAARIHCATRIVCATVCRVRIDNPHDCVMQSQVRCREDVVGHQPRRQVRRMLLPLPPQLPQELDRVDDRVGLRIRCHLWSVLYRGRRVLLHGSIRHDMT